MRNRALKPHTSLFYGHKFKILFYLLIMARFYCGTIASKSGAVGALKYYCIILACLFASKRGTLKKIDATP